MKANEFIKKYGWKVARDSVDYSFSKGAYFFTIIDNGVNFPSGIVKVNMYDLRRMVESYELIESYGGLACCKNHIGFLSDLMRQAIADVESCQ